MRSAGVSRGTRVVLISSHLPDPEPDNAGVRYLGWLTKALGAEGSITVLAPDTPSNRRAMSRPHPVERVLLPSGIAGGRLLEWAAVLRQRLIPERPPAEFIGALRYGVRTRAALEAADAVDLQWPTMAALAATVRKTAPSARLVATLHDVASQRFRRQIRTSQRMGPKLRAIASLIYARAVERRVCRVADAIVVFSEKDRRLLPPWAPTIVVYPPLSAGSERSGRLLAADPHPATAPPTAVLVGPLTRAENLEAARWLVADIWPQITSRVPSARLIIAGRADAVVQRELSHTPEVEVIGFVSDIDEIYRRADVVLAPLRSGAGVKFKVIDALVRGIPVVTTSVGLEGIGSPELDIRAYDDAECFAAAAADALLDGRAAWARAAAAQVRVAERYGLEQFEDAVRLVYGLVPPAGAPRGSADPDEQ